VGVGRADVAGVTALFHFDNAPLAVPVHDIDRFLLEQGVPAGFDAWKARTLLALVHLVSSRGRPPLISLIGELDAGAAEWLQAFCASMKTVPPEAGENDAVPRLAVLALPSAQGDCAEAQALFASCAAGSGPDGLFVTNPNPSQVVDTTHSFDGAFRALSAAGYLHLHDGYFSAWLRARAPDLLAHVRAEAQGFAGALQARMLFIIGHARSGTSALFELANYHPELLLLFESNSFLPRMRRRFAENFNSRMEARRLARRKGFFCTPPICGPDHPAAVFPALLKGFRLVGEKIALSPREDRFQSCPVKACFGYYAKWFPFAKYIFLARTPFEAAEALLRILPDTALLEILRLYAAYMAEMLQFQSIFPNSRVLFMDDFDYLNSAALNHFVGFDMLCENVTLSSECRTTRLTTAGSRWEALSYELNSMHGLYRRTHALFSTNGYEMRRDATLVEFEALVAAWRSTALDLDGRAFIEP
jgi:hypothetical protein